MSNGADIYTKLKSDHAAAASLIRKLVATQATETGKRQALFAELKNSLLRHAAAEDEVFYARLRQHEGMHSLIRDSQQEHQRIEDLLDEMDAMGPHDPLWSARLKTLKQTVEHHVGEEEGQVFAKAQRLFTTPQAEEIGRQFDHAKSQKPQPKVGTAAAGATSATTAGAQDTGQRLSDEAQRLAGEAAETGRSVAHEQQHFLATQISGVAQALRKTAEQLDGQEQRGMAHYTEQAADGLERLSRNLQNQDLTSLIGQVQDFARRQPGVFIGSAAIAGFLAARFLKSSGERQHHTAPESSYRPAAAMPSGRTGGETPAHSPTADTPAGDRHGVPTTRGGN